MKSSTDKQELFKVLEASLRSILETQSLKFQLHDLEQLSMLTMELSNDLVGFAAINGTPDTAYFSAYEAFKLLYRTNHSIWKDRNLSFVVCRLKNESNFDAFFSSIESDIYFCRKYVLNIGVRKSEVIHELLRLPFLPFPESGTGSIRRPPSAQSLLRSLKISSQLASQIVVPQKSSAKRIVEYLLNLNEQLTPVNAEFNTNAQYQPQPTESCRIKNVKINAFRSYRVFQEFNVDADIVVLFGANGLGKTSFFDAIDFACTGRIGRLCRHRINQNSFIDIARHLDSNPVEGYVNIEVLQGEKKYLVKRKVDNWSVSFINDEQYDRVGTLQFLTSAKWEEKARIENLERLFRATHLFGQSDSELLSEFTSYSTLPQDLVHRMLAMDDYNSGLNKIGESLELLEKQIKENEKLSKELQYNTVEIRTKINSMPGKDIKEAGKLIQDSTITLVEDLRTHINLRVSKIEPNQETTREWRAITESALKEAQEKHRNLNTLEILYPEYSKNLLTLKQITDEIPKLGILLEQKKSESNRKKELLAKVVNNLEQEKNMYELSKTRLNNLSKLKGFQEIYKNTKNSQKQWQLELQRLSSEENLTTLKLQPLLPKIEEINTYLSKIRENYQNQDKIIQGLNTIQEGLVTWENNRSIYKNLKESIPEIQKVILKDTNTIVGLKSKIELMNNELIKAEKEYENLTLNQNELTKLLDEIEAHVENSICPICGTDHKSKTILIDKIHSQKESRPALVNALAKQCTEIRQTLKEDSLTLERLISNNDNKKSEFQKNSHNLTLIEESIKAFEKNLISSGLKIDSQISTSIINKLKEGKAALLSLQELFKQKEAEENIISKKVKELQQNLTFLSEAVKRANTSIQPLEDQINTIRNNAATLGISLDMTSNEYDAEMGSVSARKLKEEECINHLSSQIDSLKKELTDIIIKETEVTNKINASSQKKEELERLVHTFKENAASQINREILTIELIKEQRELAEVRVDTLNDLCRRCINLEMTLDSASRTAKRAELEANFQSISKQIDTLDNESNRLLTSKKWLISVRDALQLYSSNAITHHIETFGPLSSLIQKRLRVVYGFSDVRLSAQGNEIRVEVGWGKEQVKPADYFSESQKQILMLSIYLASRFTQTWSGFAPVMMDDPVTHFDDLNAFGFVELIRGLATNSKSKKQFFISTCEDRLFELMQKKFKNLPGGAIFYRFEGIDQNGPKVTQLG
jgi:DNA repair protein SbcC/Rad50